MGEAVPEAANSNVVLSVYAMREDDAGWTVYDARSGETARIDGVVMIGLEVELASAMVDRLNQLERAGTIGVPHQ